MVPRFRPSFVRRDAGRSFSTIETAIRSEPGPRRRKEGRTTTRPARRRVSSWCLRSVGFFSYSLPGEPQAARNACKHQEPGNSEQASRIESVLVEHAISREQLEEIVAVVFLTRQSANQGQHPRSRIAHVD